MSKPVIKHQTQDGVIHTRSTNRPYTHVVVGIVNRAATNARKQEDAEGYRAWARKDAGELFDYYARVDPSKNGIKTRDEAIAFRLSRYEDILANSIAAVVDGHVFVASYSSRRELAQKDADTRNSRNSGTTYHVEAINNGVRA